MERELGLTAGQEELRPVVGQTGVGRFFLVCLDLRVAAVGMETEASLKVHGKHVHVIRRRETRRVPERDVTWRPVVAEAVHSDADDQQHHTARHTATAVPEVT